MGSGLIYAAIIVMWALYFIPRWLRRHEELSEARSVEKFDQAMRILSRKDPTPDQRYVVMPPRPEQPGRERTGRTPVPAAPRQARRSTAPADVTRERRRGPIAVRRRRVLAALVLVTVVVAALTPVTPVPWWVPAVLLLGTLGDLLHLRLQERRRSQLTRTREAVRRRTHSRLRRLDSAQRIADASTVLAKQREATEAARVEREWAELEAARLAAEREAADAAGWEPTPVPLPTYVTKPRAPRVGRPIDLTQPGRWTDLQSSPGGQEPFDQTLEDQPATRPPAVPAHPAAADRAVAGADAREAAIEELDAILERRRAVND